MERQYFAGLQTFYIVQFCMLSNRLVSIVLLKIESGAGTAQESIGSGQLRVKRMHAVWAQVAHTSTI